MSTPATPFADIQVSLNNAKRAWIEQMLAVLGKAQAAGAAASATSAQSPGAALLLKGGVPDPEDVNVLVQQTTNAVLEKKPDDSAWKEEIKSNKPKTPHASEDIPPVFQYPSRKRLILDADVRLAENTEYEKLHDDLKSKMTMDVWHEIKAQRHTLIATYLRLREYGAWDLVKKVQGIKEKLPWHGQVGSLIFGAYGTGGIAFEEHKKGGLEQKLITSGYFGTDNKIMSAMHSGQKSYREWYKEQKLPPGALDNSIHEWSEKEPTPSSSLHIALGPGTDFDAHIDRISPVTRPYDGNSVPRFPESVDHIRDEVVAPAGSGVKPDVTREKVPTGQGDKKVVTYWVKFSVEWDFPGTNKYKKGKVVNKHAPRPEPPPVEVHKRIMDRANPLTKKFPLPADGSDIDAGVIAEILAGMFLEAAKNGKDTVAFEFNDYANTPLSDADRQAVLDAMHETSQIVSSELGALAEKVRNLTVRIAAHKGADVTVEK